jgi:hypothetical protein
MPAARKLMLPKMSLNAMVLKSEGQILHCLLVQFGDVAGRSWLQHMGSYSIQQHADAHSDVQPTQTLSLLPALLRSAFSTKTLLSVACLQLNCSPWEDWSFATA